jgi:hypothetical protein
MRTRPTLLVLTAALILGALAAYASAAAPTIGSDTSAHIRVTPPAGGLQSTFAVSFVAPESSGAVDSTDRIFAVSASKTAATELTPVSACDASFAASAFKTYANTRVSVSFKPNGSWCVGTYTGRIVETIRPICLPGQACPQYIALRPIGTFKLTVTNCTTPTVPVPANEPVVVFTPGTTELIAGLYVQGGAYIIGCPQTPRGPYAGTMTLTSVNPQTTSAREVERETLHKDGKLFHFVIAPGTYTVTSSIVGGVRTTPQRVTILANHTVRQDVFVDVP